LTARSPKWMLPGLVGAVILAGVAVYLLVAASDEEGDPPVVAESSRGDSSAKPATDCSRRTARDSVIGSEFEGAVRELGVVSPEQPLFGGAGYVVVEVICSDLTGDGAEELVVELDCCAGGAPTPWAILVAGERGWQPAFYRTGIQATLSVRGSEVVERSPAYAAGEPTCCPSSFRLGRIGWNGSGFAFETDEASAGRTIEAGRRGVTQLGGFQPAGKSPAQAAEEFGPPSYVGRNGELCVNEWRDLGLRIHFTILGGVDPCAADGRADSIELEDELAAQAGWETDRGLRVGLSVRRLRDIYPDARARSLPGIGRVLVLVEAPTLIGQVGAEPVIGARIEGGVVDELRMSVGATAD
jgi:hypothetical protein